MCRGVVVGSALISRIHIVEEGAHGSRDARAERPLHWRRIPTPAEAATQLAT